MQTPYAAPSPGQTPVQTPLEMAAEFTPMPLRARGVLETLDLTIKVFRRYAGVLLAWSALIIGVCGTIGMFGAISAGKSMIEQASSGYSGGLAAEQIASLMFSSLGAMFLSFFCFPLIIGASACCVAGAVRGQRIRFTQCWSFTRPRYWSMLGQTLLAVLVMWISLFGVMIVAGIVAALGAFVVMQLPRMVAAPLGILALVCFYVAFFVVGMLAAMWLVLVPVVVCMEENNRNANAMSRALALLRGNWRRAAGLMLLAWLGILAVASITQAPFAYFMSGATTPSSGLIGATFVVQMIVWLGMLPFYTLLVTLFYLDARVRNEALDLEWSSHTGTPQATAQNVTAPNMTAPAAPANFYPQAMQPVSSVDEANVARSDASVWSGGTQNLAPMSLEAFTPQGITSQNTAPHTIQNSDENAFQPARQTQPLTDSSIETNSISPLFVAESSTRIVPSAPILNAETQTPLLSAPLTNAIFETSPIENSPVAVPENSATPETCPQCGAAVTATQTFCMNCGARLARQNNAGNSSGFGA